MKKYTFLEFSGLSKVLVTFMIIEAAVCVIAIYSGYEEYQLLRVIEAGEDYTQEQIDFNDLRQGVVGLLQVVVMLITAIAFLKWNYRMINNAYCVDDSTLTISPGWGIGYYFVPIFSLWKPYQALRDAYDVFVSKCAVDRNRIILPLWWGAYLISCFLGQIVFRFSLQAETVDSIILSTSLSMVSDAWDFILDLIGIMLVMHVSHACEECFESRHSHDHFTDDFDKDDVSFE